MHAHSYFKVGITCIQLTIIEHAHMKWLTTFTLDMIMHTCYSTVTLIELYIMYL